MYRARDFRSIARKALKGFWALSVGVALVAMLLGSTNGGSSFSVGNNSSNNTISVEVSDVDSDFPEGSVPTIVQPSGIKAVTQSEYFKLFRGGISQLLENRFIQYAAVTAAVVLICYSIVRFVIGGAIELGENRYCIDLLTREHEPEFKTLFSRFSIFGKALGLQLLTGIFILLWSLLLIVPGMIAAYRYALAPYLMAEDPEMGVMESIEKSKELMKGNKWRLFCLQMSFIGWNLLSVLTLDILSLWIRPYSNVATAAFYLEVTGRADMMPKPEA